MALKRCCVCKEEKPFSEFYRKSEKNRDSLSYRCKQCERRQMKEYRQADPGRFRIRDRAYYQKNRERITAQLYERNRVLRQQVFDLLGRRCVRCGFSDERALQIDHINGGGATERKTLNLPTMHKKILREKGVGYQILCANCNWIKRAENKEAGGIANPQTSAPVQ